MLKRMQQEYGAADTIGNTLSFVKEKIDGLLVGQPLVAIGITLAFDGILEHAGLQLKPDGTPVSAAALAILPPFVVYLMSSSLVSGIVSAALIYWFAQLLPQSLGKRNAVEFMRMPLAATVARTLVQLSATGVGAPSRVLEQILSSRFRSGVGIPIGDERIFTALSSDFGYFVSKRQITIRPNSDFVEVIDEISYHYLEHRPDIRHSCKLPVEQFNGQVQFTLLVPANVAYQEPTIVAFEHELSRVSNPGPGGTAAFESQIREQIFVVESSIAENRPLTTRAVYRRDPLITRPADRDSLVFDMGVPTKEIDIRIERQNGVLINDEPKVAFISEVARFFPVIRHLQLRGPTTTVKHADGWYIKHVHTPFCAEMRLVIDARLEAVAGNHVPA